ncbi:MAG: glucose-6-phosphate dehydrogenase assembly protein OpcA [Rhabdochlamydiaceae bacterium]|jgi:glucose-6-phosphate dehydrogenase assembly protein OpcA
MTALSTHLVSPEDIQNQLNRIWESLETKNIARACLFNLIFYTQKNHRMPYIHKIAQKVVEKFPSRVIFVSVDNKATEGFLKTEVSILNSSKGEFDVACDYIQIEAGGTYRERIPFVVLPHILPDLPVYLIWAEDPSQGDRLSEHLEQFAGRLIFDSESTDNLPRFANSVLDYHSRAHCDIADLNWARIESWRDILSMAFYSEDNLNQVQHTRQITITYNAQETPFFCHTKIQSIYLQAWLACQLGWQFQTLRIDKNQLCFTYQGPFNTIEISLIATQHTKLPPGLILSLDLQTTQDEQFKFNRHLEQMHQISFQHSTPSQCALPCQYIFTKAESGHSLVKEICHRGTSEHYLKVLNLVKKMDNLRQC